MYTTNNKTTQHKQVELKQPQPFDASYPYGFNERKLERQAIKGLTPKYCYAGYSSDISANNGVTVSYLFDSYTHNDSRFEGAANAITVPQAGIRQITLNLYTTAQAGSYGGNIKYYIKRNGNYNFGLIYGAYNKYLTGVSESFDVITFLYNLDQGDTIKVDVQNNLGQAIYVESMSKLSLHSYVLF